MINIREIGMSIFHFKFKKHLAFNLKMRIVSFFPILIGKRKIFDNNINKIKISKTKSYILLYHAFTSEYKDQRYNFCNISKFMSDIVNIKNNFTFSNKLEERIRKPTVFLTFDDGYKSILPILQFLELNKIPSTIFLNGAIMNNRMLSKDKIRTIISYLPDKSIVEFFGLKIQLTKNLRFRDYLSMTLNNYLQKKFTPKEYVTYCQKFYNTYASKCNPEDLKCLQMLTKKDVRYIVGSLKFCRIEYHGYSHYDLSNASKSEIMKEINSPTAFCRLIQKKTNNF